MKIFILSLLILSATAHAGDQCIYEDVNVNRIAERYSDGWVFAEIEDQGELTHLRLCQLQHSLSGRQCKARFDTLKNAMNSQSRVTLFLANCRGNDAKKVSHLLSMSVTEHIE